jgi:hypothetical protein
MEPHFSPCLPFASQAHGLSEPASQSGTGKPNVVAPSPSAASSPLIGWTKIAGSMWFSSLPEVPPWWSEFDVVFFLA